MFTGIIEETGVVEAIKPGGKAIRLSLSCKLCAKGAKLGDSLAVNGACLTIVKINRRAKFTLLDFDLLQETWNRTSFASTKVGQLVNLERPLAANGRLHGHFVTGHVDGVGVIKTMEQQGADWFIEVSTPKEILRGTVLKGSIAIDGISLTVAKVTRGSLAVWIIPHTRAVTALSERRAGDLVNLEADLLGKYVVQLLDRRAK